MKTAGETGGSHCYWTRPQPSPLQKAPDAEAAPFRATAIRPSPHGAVQDPPAAAAPLGSSQANVMCSQGVARDAPQGWGGTYQVG